MKLSIHQASGLFVAATLAFAMNSCGKSELVEPISPKQNTDELNGEKAGPREAEYIFRSDDNAGFYVHNSWGCDYGYVNGGYATSHSFDPVTGGIFINYGNCDYPYPGSPLLLRRGTTSGSLGPIYYITPTSYSTCKVLQLRIRNVAGAVPSDYNRQFQYHPLSNTWTWDSSASTYFSFTVLTLGPACQGPGKN